MFTNPTNGEIAELLKSARTIAVVGFSNNPDRPSHWISVYLQQNGFRVVPVNPGIDAALGEKCYKTLAAVPDEIDIVNIFRSPDQVPPVVADAITKKARAVWMQEGAENFEAAAASRAAGMITIVGRCIFRDHGMLVKNL